MQTNILQPWQFNPRFNFNNALFPHQQQQQQQQPYQQHQQQQQEQQQHQQYSTPLAVTNSAPPYTFAFTNNFSPSPTMPIHINHTNRASPSPRPKPFKVVFVEFPTKGYTDRYLRFVVKIIDSGTGETLTETNGWQLYIHLFDGNNQLCDDKLVKNTKECHQLTLHQGKSEITCLKIMKVSSKCGGYFELLCGVSSLDVDQARSPHIVIGSCRIMNDSKLVENLKADDDISKMPGVGKVYAAKFKANRNLLVQTIGDLAKLPDDEHQCSVDERSVKVLEGVRTKQGPLTDKKLVNLIKQAKSIVERSQIVEIQPPHSSVHLSAAPAHQTWRSHDHSSSPPTLVVQPPRDQGLTHQQQQQQLPEQQQTSSNQLVAPIHQDQSALEDLFLLSQPTPPPTTTTTLPVILEDNMPAVCVDYPTHTHQCGLPADLFPNTLLFPPRFECYDDSYYNSYEPSKMFSAKHTPTKYQDTNDHCLSDTESAISDIDKLLF